MKTKPPLFSHSLRALPAASHPPPNKFGGYKGGSSREELIPPYGKEGVKKETLRLLDANLNRCREGLRVLEDTSRFVWENSLLYHAFRDTRHALARISKAAYPQLVAARDTKTDAGRKILEENRAELKDLVRANLRRAEESLRVLEEYGKVFSNSSQDKFKVLRFRLYELEKKCLNLNHDS